MSLEHLQQGFDKKYIFCGEYCILKEYTQPHAIGVKRSEYAVKSNDNSANKPKRFDSLKRTRDSVAQIVYANLTDYTKFLTLTTKETILYVSEFQRKLQTFIQQMRRNNIDLRYIYVYERQKERGRKEGNIGALHVHMVIFNEDYIDMNLLKKCWKHGRVELKILYGLRCKDNKTTNEIVNNPASYLCKYITKESVAEWNEKVYRCSKNLKRPFEVNNEVYYTSDDGFVTPDSEALYDHFKETYVTCYENSKTIRCSTDSGLLNYVLSTTIGRMEK